MQKLCFALFFLIGLTAYGTFGQLDFSTTTCGEPPAASGAYVSRKSSSTRVTNGVVNKTETIAYSCINGKRPLSGDTTLYCFHNAKTWTGKPPCCENCNDGSTTTTTATSTTTTATTTTTVTSTQEITTTEMEVTTQETVEPTTEEFETTTQEVETTATTQEQTTTTQKPTTTTTTANATRVLAGGLRGPQCRYGTKLPHSFCLNDSEALDYVEKVNIDEVLQAHNYWRANVQPPAQTPLPPLMWDSDLAVSAERWAAQCTYGHNEKANRAMPNRDDNGPAWPWVGQNICYASGVSQNFTECIKSWASERNYWQYNVGQTGVQAVGHYTQIIWESTLYVGCGKARCNEGEWEYILVCNYGPGGNVGMNGANPFATPYKSAAIRPL